MEVRPVHSPSQMLVTVAPGGLKVASGENPNRSYGEDKRGTGSRHGQRRSPAGDLSHGQEAPDGLGATPRRGVGAGLRPRRRSGRSRDHDAGPRDTAALVSPRLAPLGESRASAALRLAGARAPAELDDPGGSPLASPTAASRARALARWRVRAVRAVLATPRCRDERWSRAQRGSRAQRAAPPRPAWRESRTCVR